MTANQADQPIHNFSQQILEFWPTIAQAWNDHFDQRPAIELDVNEDVIKVFPVEAYFKAIADSERQSIRYKFEKLVAEGGITIFIKDRKRRIFQMFQLTPADMVELTKLHRAKVSLGS